MSFHKRFSVSCRATIALAGAFCVFVAVAACGPDVPQQPTDNGLAKIETKTELSAELQAGRTLYRANGCETCHGVQGKGDGPAGAGLNPPPRNLLETAGYRQGASEAAIARTLETGVPGTLMQSYRHIKADDRRSIARYILHLRDAAQDPESGS